MKVLILEDHHIVAFTLSRIVKETIGVVDVVITGSFVKGLSLLKAGLRADLVILDIGLPDADSNHMVEALRSIQQNVRILVFTGNEEHATALRFLSAGVSGYLTKSQPVAEVGIAIERILSGQRYVTEEMKKLFGIDFYSLSGAGTARAQFELSPREKEVLAFLLDGKQTKQISTTLNLKLTTVSAHKARIFDKFQVSNVIELYKKVKTVL